MMHRTLQKIEHACGLLSKALTGFMHCIKKNYGSMVMLNRRSQLDPNICLQNDSLEFLVVFEYSSDFSYDLVLSVTKCGMIDAQVRPILGGDSLDGLL